MKNVTLEKCQQIKVLLTKIKQKLLILSLHFFFVFFLELSYILPNKVVLLQDGTFLYGEFVSLRLANQPDWYRLVTIFSYCKNFQKINCTFHHQWGPTYTFHFFCLLLCRFVHQSQSTETASYEFRFGSYFGSYSKVIYHNQISATTKQKIKSHT